MKLKRLGIATAIMLASMEQSLAIGLGDIEVSSALEEPFQGVIHLRNVGELSELEMIVGLASERDFRNAGVEREFYLTGLNFSVDLDNPRDPVIRVSSNKPINEPYLDFLIELEWPSGRLLREYTVLLDLPSFVTADVAPKAIERPQASTPSRPASPQPVSSSSGQQSQSRDVLAGGDSYEVVAGDTLWGIAQRSRPEGYSINETLDAIHQLNPSAFINNDVNLIKKGAVIRLPEGSDVEQLANRGDALSSVLAPTADPYASDDLPVSDVDTGYDTDSVDDIVADTTSYGDDDLYQEPQSSGGRLKLSALTSVGSNQEEPLGYDSLGATSSSDSPSGGSAGLGADNALVEEELSLAQRENEELKQRVANLEEQLATMERMVELEDSTAAALQSNQAANASGDNGGSKSEDASAEKPKQTPKAKVADNQDSSLLSKLFYPLIVLVALLVAAFLFFRSRKRDEADDDEAFAPGYAAVAAPDEDEDEDDFDEVDQDDDEDRVVECLGAELAVQGPAARIVLADTLLEDLARARPADEEFDPNLAAASLELDQHESMDLLAQAEINIELGNLVQAESLLKEALQAEPDNTACHLKLLEVYAAQGDLAQFDMQRAELSQLDDQDADREAADLREKLIAEQPSGDSASDDLADLSADLDDLDLDQLSADIDEFDFDLDSDVDADVEEPAEEATADDVEAVEPEADEAAANIDEAPPAAPIADDIDVEEECATKLDLAEAYLEMGDDEAAREALEEVINDGSDDQKAKAQELLSGLNG
ncbi:MAG: FimV/HubP family polar landmark protein [bacterium]